MKKILSLGSVLLPLLIFSGCEQIEQVKSLLSKKETKKAQPMQMPPQVVVVMPAHKQDVPLSFEFPSRLISEQDIEVRSKVSGTLLKQLHKAGENVKKGDVLFKIDDEMYRATYNVQLANLEVAKANFNKSAKDFQRLKSLYAKKAASQKDYDNSRASYEISKASVAQAKASLENAKINLNYTDIIAPFDGILGDELVDVGSFIPTNTPLIRLTSIDKVYAEFFISDVENLNIQDNLKSNLWSKMDSKVSLEYGGKTYNGKMVFLDKIVDSLNGSVKAKAVFENKNNSLPVGSFAKLKIEGFSQKNAFKVPSMALQQELANTMLFVVQKNKDQNKPPKDVLPFMIPDGTVKAIRINVDYEKDDFVLASGDIKEGDMIIMSNFKKIRPGSQIKIVGEYGKAPKQTGSK